MWKVLLYWRCKSGWTRRSLLYISVIYHMDMCGRILKSLWGLMKVILCRLPNKLSLALVSGHKKRLWSSEISCSERQAHIQNHSSYSGSFFIQAHTAVLSYFQTLAPVYSVCVFRSVAKGKKAQFVLCWCVWLLSKGKNTQCIFEVCVGVCVLRGWWRSRSFFLWSHGLSRSIEASGGFHALWTWIQLAWLACCTHWGRFYRNTQTPHLSFYTQT